MNRGVTSIASRKINFLAAAIDDAAIYDNFIARVHEGESAEV